MRRTVVVLAGLMAPALAIGQEPEGGTAAARIDRPVELRFLDGLRERGYYDLGLEYLDELRRGGGAAPAAAEVLDFEEATTLLDEAKFTPDLQRREQLFGAARTKVEAFLKDHAAHPLALEARVLLAQLVYQRGQTEVLRAGESATAALKEEGLEAARASYAAAARAFDEAIGPLQAAYDAFPTGFLEEDDPRRSARERAHIALMDAQLKRALVDFELAQTYAPESAERKGSLDAAIGQFQGLDDRYRTWMTGFAARMWRGRCFEEQGELGAAIGVYNNLLENEDPRLYPLKRQVAYFKIIATGKRGEYPLAERLAREWLAISQNDEWTYERLGVQLELAKSLDQQLAASPDVDPARRRQAVEDIVGHLSRVVRVVSPFKAEAVALLRKYRPAGGVDPRTLPNLGYEQALAEAREAMGLEEYEAAAIYLRTALERVDAGRSPEKANAARYLLAYAEYQLKHYYEAAVLASFLAGRYPESEMGPESAELALSAMALGYDDLPGPGREAELARLEAFARLVETRFKDEDQADVARILRGDIALGQGRYAEAAAVFEAVESPTRKLDAQAKAAAAWWRLSLVERRRAGEGEAIPADAAEAALKARSILERTIAARRDQQEPPTSPELLSNLGDLAEIHVAEGRPAEALDLLVPATEALAAAPQGGGDRALAARLWKLQLQAHIGAGDSGAAVEDMRALEQASRGEPLTQLFFGLGRLLQKELDELRARGDGANLRIRQQSFEKFLDALVESAGGQSFESLQWAGETMLDLDRPGKAIEMFDRVLADFPNHERIDRTRLRRVTALRASGKFEEAWAQVDRLVRANPRGLDFLLERCLLLEDWAKAERGRWNAAIKYWQDLARMMERQKPRPAEFYDAWYHVAWCYQQSGNDEFARKTLRSIMAVSTTLGTPEIKAKYEQLLGRLGS